MATPIEKYPGPLSKRSKICWLISVIIPIIIMCIPLNDVFTSQARLFLAITLLFILVLAFELTDSYVPALFLPVAYAITKVSVPAVVFSPWLGELPWVIIGALLLVSVVEKTGLLRRVAFWAIIRFGGTYNGVLYGFMFAGIVLNFLLPGGIMVPLIAIAYGVCTALELGHSKTATGIMIASGIGAALPTMFIYAPSYFGVTFNSAKTIVPSLELTFLQFAFHNAIFIVFCIIMIVITTKMFKPDVPFQGKKYFQDEYSKLGQMTSEEKRAALVVVALVIYLATMGLHKLGMGWGFVLSACAMFIPGINLGTASDIRNINMSVVLFVTSCLSIGIVATSLGLGTAVTNALLPYLSGASTVGLFSIIWIVTFILNFIMTPAAIIAILAGPLAQIAIDLNINPLPVLYGLSSSSDQVLLPYEYINYLFLYSFGVISSKDFFKFFGVKSIVHFVFLMCLAIPYWKLIGLL